MNESEMGKPIFEITNSLSGLDQSRKWSPLRPRWYVILPSSIFIGFILNSIMIWGFNVQNVFISLAVFIVSYIFAHLFDRYTDTTTYLQSVITCIYNDILLVQEDELITRYAWSLITEIRKDKHEIYFMRGNRCVHLIPLKALGSDNDAEALLEHLRRLKELSDNTANNNYSSRTSPNTVYLTLKNKDYINAYKKRLFIRPSLYMPIIMMACLSLIRDLTLPNHIIRFPFVSIVIYLIGYIFMMIGYIVLDWSRYYPDALSPMKISLTNEGMKRSGMSEEQTIRWNHILSMNKDKRYIKIYSGDNPHISLAKQDIQNHLRKNLLIPIAAFSNKVEADNFYALCVQCRQAALNNEPVVLPEAPETWPPAVSTDNS